MTRTAVVTGASRNIGLAIVKDLLSDGAEVVAVARDFQRLQTAFDAEAYQGRLHLRAADLGSVDETNDLIDSIRAEVGHVHVLVNSAVQRVTYPLAEHPLDEFRMAVDVVLTSAFQLMQAFVPAMGEAGYGRVINFAGMSAQKGAPYRSAVVAPKAALMGLSKTVALEYADHGVTVNVVSPGPIETDRGEWTASGDREKLEALYDQRRREIPMGRRGEIREVVALCRYLLSDDAAFMTGQTLSINGGLYMP